MPNHNTGIVVQPATCTQTHTHKENIHILTCTHGNSHIHTQLHALRHRHARPLMHFPHTYALCGSCYYAILQVMNQSICLQSVSKWERKRKCYTAALLLLYWGCTTFSALLFYSQIIFLPLFCLLQQIPALTYSMWLSCLQCVNKDLEEP